MENKKKKSLKKVAVGLGLALMLFVGSGIGYVSALIRASLKLGGNVSFDATNVYATIFDGAISGGTLETAEDKLQNIVFDMNDSSLSSSTVLDTWKNLIISFNKTAEDVTISFKVSNNHTEKNLKFIVGISDGTFTNVNRKITINNEEKSENDSVVLAKNGAFANVVITFAIKDKNQSAAITDFSFDFDLETTDDTATINALAYKYSPNGENILFGSFPQTIKDSDVRILGNDESSNINGMYLGSDGAKYIKYTVDYTSLDEYAEGMSDIFVDDLKMNEASDGTLMQNNNEYYFKMEDLEWRIVDIDDNNIATLVCNSIIQSMPYQGDYIVEDGYYYVKGNDGSAFTENGNKIYANNYKYSTLREYLDAIYLFFAFDESQQNIIQSTTVDNSSDSTASSDNIYACANTTDRVWALSYREFMKLVGDETGEDIDVSKFKNWLLPTTDLAKATGAVTINKDYCEANNISVYQILGWYNMRNEGDDENMTYENDCTLEQKEFLDTFYASGVWWLRSPCGSLSSSACDVFIDFIGNFDVFSPMLGAVPALQIQL